MAEEGSGRPLAYIAEVHAIDAIPGCDKIAVARLRGKSWRVIVGKESCAPGDRVVYCEIDSVLPRWQCFVEDGLAKNDFRIRTVKIRGQLSQGYIFNLQTLRSNHPLSASFTLDLAEKPSPVIRFTGAEAARQPIVLDVGVNLTDFVGVVHWFPSVTESTEKKGTPAEYLPFPAHLFPKTDQPRIQNLPEFPVIHADVPFEVTEKIDGTSVTAYTTKAGESAVCTRNYRLDLVACKDMSVVQHLQRIGVLSALEKCGRPIALQGEFIGPGISGNPYRLTEFQWRIFDVFLIEEGRFCLPRERIEFIQSLGLDPAMVHVPVLQRARTIRGATAEGLVEEADGKSVLTQQKGINREGLVFKSEELVDGNVVHFKAVSNTFLLRHNQ